MGAVGGSELAHNCLHVEHHRDNLMIEGGGDFLVQFTFDELFGPLGLARCKAAPLVVERNISAFSGAASFAIER